MEETVLNSLSGASLCIFDERGALIGTIRRPLARDPFGPGRATVFLARPAEREERPAAA